MLSPSSIAAEAATYAGSGGTLDESVDRFELTRAPGVAAIAETWRAILADGPALGLTVTFFDTFGEPLAEISPSVARIVIEKPKSASIWYFFTIDGFRKALFDQARLATVRRIHVAQETTPFSTLAFRVEPWLVRVPDDALPQAPLPPSPRRFVRDLGAGVVPVTIADALLTSPAPAESGAFTAWRAIAVARLRCALASEAWQRDGVTFLGFAGPRYVEVRVGDDDPSPAFALANEAATWVYEGPDVGARLVLFVAELARDWPSDSDWTAPFVRLAPTALATAQRAHRAQLVEQSGEILKSLGDLRKGLADEISKTVQATRDLIGASWRDFTIAIAALIARLTIFNGAAPADVRNGRVLLLAVGFALVLSYAISAYTTWRFNANATQTRATWRKQLYAYLSDNEYDAVASRPLASANAVYYLSATVLGFAYVAMVALLLAIGFEPATQTSGASGSPVPRVSPSHRVHH